MTAKDDFYPASNESEDVLNDEYESLSEEAGESQAPAYIPPGALTPRQIVEELNRYIIGQDRAKRCVAVALRNRWRRQKVSSDLKDEIAPKNILMIGPTGVGKTEISRRLARLAQSPFLKVEASKFTEVGYVGRDVDSMIRDLVEISVNMVRREQEASVMQKAKDSAEDRLLDILLPPPPKRPKRRANSEKEGQLELALEDPYERYARTREKMRQRLEKGEMDNRHVEIEVTEVGGPVVEVLSSGAEFEEMNINFRDMIGNIFPPRKKRRKVTVSEAKRILAQEEAEKLIDMDEVVKRAIDRAEQAGIIFIDELDKISGRETKGVGPDVSREGVQRDLLPIIEGSTVSTRYGIARTSHILFIAAGAFNVAKPSDLIPELQGRFPIRAELDSLSEDDFVKILTEPKNALIKQYAELLATEGVKLSFTSDGINEIAKIAALVNSKTENIGARRLHTVMEKLLQEVSFEAPDLAGKEIVVDAAYVRKNLSDIVADEDLSRYIL